MVQSAQPRSRLGGRGRSVTVAAALALLTGYANAQVGKLVAADKVRMLDCEGSGAPSFRLQFNVARADGTAEALPLPSDKQLANNLRILIDNQEIVPFYAAASGVAPAAPSPRTVLILIDISGSMKNGLGSGQTRFEAAKDAVAQFLATFHDGVDRVAIAPFESHQVEHRIDSAPFVSSAAEAKQQLDALPSPNGLNNTALYSAFDLGLKKLQNEGNGAPNSLLQLFLVTDGHNDVNHPNDDPGLLSDDTGPQIVLHDVREYSQIRVNAIGVGDPQDPQEVDQATLGRISNSFVFCTDAEHLKAAFAGPSAPPVSQGLRATVTSPWRDRARLAARTVHFQASLLLPAGGTLESEDVTWSAPEIGTPLFEGRCDPGEETALIEGGKEIASVGWISSLRPMMVFIGIAGLLLVLWFWVPRLVWPERYGQTFQPQRDARWTPPTVAIPAPVPAAKRPAPPGFEHGPEGVRAPQRAPADATRVLPINKMGTRTRLELRRVVDADRR